MSKFVWFIIALVALVAGIIVYNKVLHGKDKTPVEEAESIGGKVGVHAVAIRAIRVE